MDFSQFPISDLLKALGQGMVGAPNIGTGIGRGAGLFGQQMDYNKTLQNAFGNPMPNEVQVTPQRFDGQTGPTPQPLQNQQAMSYSGPVGQMLGGSASSTLLPLLKNTDPSIGLPLLLSTYTKAAQHQQDVADKTTTNMTPEEIAAAGLPKGTAAQKDAFGNINIISKPDYMSQDAFNQKVQLEKLSQGPQWASVANSRADLAEKKREFDASNPLTAGAGGQPVTLDTMPASTKSMVQAMVDGRQAPPTSFALSKPYWQNMMALANQVDPTFDQTTWGARFNLRKDMTGGGKSYQLLNAGNTAIQHLGRLYSQIPDVAGHQIPLVGNALNYAENAASQASGTPGVNAYNDTLGHLAEETTKFYRGTGGAEGDVQRNMGNLAANLSTPQKQAGVANTVHLIYGKLTPMVEQYNNTMGTKFPPSHFLSKEAVKTIRNMGFDPDSGDPLPSGNAQGGGWSIKLKGN